MTLKSILEKHGSKKTEAKKCEPKNEPIEKPDFENVIIGDIDDWFESLPDGSHLEEIAKHRKWEAKQCAKSKSGKPQAE